jgi:hypothetical protein
MKNKIEIGSRWRSVGRNLPSEEIKVKMFSTCPSALTGLRYVTTECGRDYNENFFLDNFEPIVEEKGCKLETDVIDVKENGVFTYIGNNLIYLPNEIITLLEPAKIDLAVGQVWSDDNKAYYVLDIYRGRVIFRWTIAGSNKWGIDEMRDSEFKDQYARKLISEAGDE